MAMNFEKLATLVGSGIRGAHVEGRAARFGLAGGGSLSVAPRIDGSMRLAAWDANDKLITGITLSGGSDAAECAADAMLNGGASPSWLDRWQDPAAKLSEVTASWNAMATEARAAARRLRTEERAMSHA